MSTRLATATREGAIGQMPPKFSQTYVFVRYKNKLHHFAPPPKILVGCGPDVDCQIHPRNHLKSIFQLVTFELK